jgi:hypothetical protein
LAAAQGKSGSWQAIAEANNIENPRLLAPGQLSDMNATLPKVSAGASVPFGAGVSGGAGVGASGSLTAGVRAGGVIR